MKTLFHRGELPHNGKPVYFVRRKTNGKPYLRGLQGRQSLLLLPIIGQITWIGDGWEFRDHLTGRRFKFDTLAEAKDESRKS